MMSTKEGKVRHLTCFKCGKKIEKLEDAVFTEEWDTYCHKSCCPAFTDKMPDEECFVCPVYIREKDIRRTYITRRDTYLHITIPLNQPKQELQLQVSAYYLTPKEMEAYLNGIMLSLTSLPTLIKKQENQILLKKISLNRKAPSARIIRNIYAYYDGENLHFIICPW